MYGYNVPMAEFISKIKAQQCVEKLKREMPKEWDPYWTDYTKGYNQAIVDAVVALIGVETDIEVYSDAVYLTSDDYRIKRNMKKGE
mgnify:CR=1 FL=1